MQAIDRMLIGINNAAVKGRRPRVKAEEILVLLPSCLQASKCKRNVVCDIKECARCGQCKTGGVLDICDRLGVRPALAKGGRVAVALAKAPEIKAIIAVACEKELRAGIIACLPKPVYAILNTRPNGPCNETDVELDKIERAINWLTRTAAK